MIKNFLYIENSVELLHLHFFLALHIIVRIYQYVTLFCLFQEKTEDVIKIMSSHQSDVSLTFIDEVTKKNTC